MTVVRWFGRSPSIRWSLIFESQFCSTLGLLTWETRMANYDKKWLVMIYLSGDNDLSEECVWSLTEIFRAGKSDDVAVVVQIDPRAARIRRFDVNRILK